MLTLLMLMSSLSLRESRESQPLQDHRARPAVAAVVAGITPSRAAAAGVSEGECRDVAARIAEIGEQRLALAQTMASASTVLAPVRSGRATASEREAARAFITQARSSRSNVAGLVLQVVSSAARNRLAVVAHASSLGLRGELLAAPATHGEAEQLAKALRAERRSARLGKSTPTWAAQVLAEARASQRVVEASSRSVTGVAELFVR